MSVMQLIDERNRLTADDDRFLRMHRVYGTSIAMQTVWHLAVAPDAAIVEEFGARLGRGPLARSVRRPTVPGARPSWRPLPDSGVVTIARECVPVTARRAWLDARAAAPVDPVRGPAWRLDCVPLDDGTAVLSLLASHVVADGTAVMGAIGAAGLGLEPPAIPVAEPAPSTLGRVAADAADAGASIAAALRSAAAMARRALTPTRDTDPQVIDSAGFDSTASTSFTEAMSEPAFPPVSTLIRLRSEDVDAAAKARGGTVNSLFVAASVGILRRAGRVSAEQVVRVDLPMSHRGGPGDLRSNITTGARAAVPAAADYTDLGAVRSACRAAFAAVSADRAEANLAQPLEQVLPDFVVRRAAVAATLPLCLASNLGTVPELLANPMGMTSTLVAGRAVTDLSAESLRHMRGGLATSLTGSGEHLTFGSLSADPDLLGDSELLTRLALEEFAAWGLTGEPW